MHGMHLARSPGEYVPWVSVRVSVRVRVRVRVRVMPTCFWGAFSSAKALIISGAMYATVPTPAWG